VRILITGGNSWIAQAIAIDRLARGDDVCLTASSPASLTALQTTCRERGLVAACGVFDLCHPHELSVEVRDGLAAADGVVLNAATRVPALERFHDLPADQVDAAVDADIKGNLFLLRTVLPGMAERRFGRIVFVSSVSVAMGTSRYGAYCLTKSALEGLILNLAVDYGDRNVLSNIVRLGLFKTRRTERFWRSEAYVERAASMVPQGRLGDVDAVPEAIHPLLSARQYINGSVVTVAGGLPLLPATALRARTDR
jgi:NAD(P)-dependent dehydrogenase (short-subunit alcohol dehydrogenase family)